MEYVEVWSSAARGTQGRHVRRASWAETDSVRWEANRSSVAGITYTPLWMQETASGDIPWVPSLEDLEASDWELVPVV